MSNVPTNFKYIINLNHYIMISMERKCNLTATTTKKTNRDSMILCATLFFMILL